MPPVGGIWQNATPLTLSNTHRNFGAILLTEETWVHLHLDSINQSIDQSLRRPSWGKGLQRDSVRHSGPEPVSPNVPSCILFLCVAEWRS